MYGGQFRKALIIEDYIDKKARKKNSRFIRGFTLIELLAVIVILAVITLIATPLVLNIIERAEKGAFKDSAYGMIEAVEFQVLLENTKYPITYVFPEDNNRIKFKGTKPNEGYIQIVTEGKIKIAIGNGRWCAVKDINDSQVTIQNGPCKVIDLKLPIISGYGEVNQEININETYMMPSVTATDSKGNKLNVITTIKQGESVVDTIDTSKPSTYTITYTTEPDKEGNTNHVTVTITIIKKAINTDKVIENGINSGGLELIDHTYYYRGSNPNNYVQFNNELWRIISIEDGLMKIIRNTIIEDQTWDNSNSNNWNRPADIRTYLNETFYNTLSAKAKDQMQDGAFYIGVVNNKALVTAAQVKANEMSTVWIGKVGLMNASDYVYSSKTDDSNASSCINKALYNTDCKNGWLYSGKKEWTINASSYSTPYVFYVYTSGSLYGDAVSEDYADKRLAARPVIFLRSDVSIAPGGKGTANLPYVIQ